MCTTVLWAFPLVLGGWHIVGYEDKTVPSKEPMEIKTLWSIKRVDMNSKHTCDYHPLE